MGCLFAAAVLASNPSVAASAAVATHALIGDWEFDPSRSEFSGAIPYREAQISFRRTTRCIEVKQRILEGNARELRFSYCAGRRGERSTVVGNPFYDGQSTQWLDERTAIRTEYRGTAVSGSTTMVVSPDGKTYTAAGSRTLPNGRQYVSKIVWNRVTQAHR